MTLKTLKYRNESCGAEFFAVINDDESGFLGELCDTKNVRVINYGTTREPCGRPIIRFLFFLLNFGFIVMVSALGRLNNAHTYCNCFFPFIRLRTFNKRKHV